MTRTEAIQEAVGIATAEVGFSEGSDNWNPYAADLLVTEALGWDAQYEPWCAIFNVWVFVKAFGLYAGNNMIYGSSASCAQQAANFENNNAFYEKPEVGDIAFFVSGGGINHQGIVAEVFDSGFKTIEGNYSDSVCEVLHNLSGRDVAGFGRPLWDIVAKDEEQPNPVVEREYPTLRYGDGINNPSPIVAAWQNLLIAWGYSVGKPGADGEFGSLTLSATQKWQQSVFCSGDGIVTKADWQEIIEIPKKGGAE